MKNLLKSKWIVIGLALCAVGSLVHSIVLPLMKSSSSADVTSINMIEDIIDPLLDGVIGTLGQPLSDITQSKSSIEISKLSWTENPRRNPFQPLPKDKKTPIKNIMPVQQKLVVTPQLEAIIINDHARYAVLNTEIITTGDTLGEFSIRSIQTNHVDLAGPDGQIRLHLIEPILEKK